MPQRPQRRPPGLTRRRRATATATANATPVADPPPFGPLTEEQFKALHQLKKGQTPPHHGQMIRIAGVRAYLSLPPGAHAHLPGIVLVHEWWGLNDNIEFWADRLAGEGYAALAVNLYGGVVATTPDQALAAMKSVNPGRALEILRAAHHFLRTDARVLARHTASIGWCFGGGWSLRLALAEPDQDAAVMYYGRPVLDPAKLAPLHANLLAIFGTQDPSLPPATVDAFDRALTAAGKHHRILRYDAPHAFANPSQPSYHPAQAAAAWAQARAFLAAHLKPGQAGAPAQGT